MDQNRLYLISKGWELVMTEEDGCETWRVDMGIRKCWPAEIDRTQHYWDFNEAWELQCKIDNIVARKNYDEILAENERLKKRIIELTNQLFAQAIITRKQFEYDQDYLPYEEDHHDR